MHDNFKDKATSFHKEIARKQREQIFAKKRLELYEAQHQYPLSSICLQKFWPLSAREIPMYQDDIFDTLDGIKTEELSEQEHAALCSDILFLLTSGDDFRIPYKFSFKKDGSPYTAAVVAYAMASLSDQEITYWLTYMNEDTKTVLYLNIFVQEETYETWLKMPEFVDEVVKDWGYIEEAEYLLFRMMEQGDWYEDWEMFEQVRERLIEMKKTQNFNYTSKFFPIICHLLIYLLSTNSLDKKVLSTIMFFNEALIDLFKKDQTFDLGDQFVCIVDMMMEYARQYSKIIFVKEAFNGMCILLMNNFHAKFVNTQSDKYMKKHMLHQNADKVKSKFIERLINTCVNYLRMSTLYNQHVQIPENLMVMIEAEKEPIHEHIYEKLFNFNSAQINKQTKTTSTKSHFEPQTNQKNSPTQFDI